MSEIINLNKFRKARAKTERAAKAAENRTRFGQTKQTISEQKSKSDRAEAILDGKLLDPETK